MENADLKWIKKHYGEKFSHLCRELFPSLLDSKGLLSKLISDHFMPSRELYYDLIQQNLIVAFKNYIYKLANIDTQELKSTNLTPEELMDKAGYILYPECQTEEDVQRFRHYYYRGEPTPEYHGGIPERRKGEELCTFNGGRLESDRVWFAVRKDVDEIKRENFKNPRREDDYGVSVISIQFTRSTPSTLSIKNRYNHTIQDVNPDDTFGNNLDNIIEGLTQSFIDTYSIELRDKGLAPLEIPGYVQANDGKFYKYNLEVENVYYCSNNIVIQNGMVKQFDKDKFLVFDYFVLDIENKKIIDYNYETYKRRLKCPDAFVDSIGKIKEIKRVPSSEGLTILITPEDGEVVEIKLNKHNEIISYSNPNVKKIGKYFLAYNKALSNIELPNVTEINRSFLSNNRDLKQIDLPSVEIIADYFLDDNNSIEKINLPNVQRIGDLFLSRNNSLTEIHLPKVQRLGDYFLWNNKVLTKISIPNLRQAELDFLMENSSLVEAELPVNYEYLKEYLLAKIAKNKEDNQNLKNKNSSAENSNNESNLNNGDAEYRE